MRCYCSRYLATWIIARLEGNDAAESAPTTLSRQSAVRIRGVRGPAHDAPARALHPPEGSFPARISGGRALAPSRPRPAGEPDPSSVTSTRPSPVGPGKPLLEFDRQRGLAGTGPPASARATGVCATLRLDPCRMTETRASAAGAAFGRIVSSSCPLSWACFGRASPDRVPARGSHRLLSRRCRPSGSRPVPVRGPRHGPRTPPERHASTRRLMDRPRCTLVTFTGKCRIIGKYWRG